MSVFSNIFNNGGNSGGGFDPSPAGNPYEEGKLIQKTIAPINNQTIFDVIDIIYDPKKHLTEMLINGIQQQYLVDFTVTNNIITFIDSSYIIKNTDSVIFYYFII